MKRFILLTLILLLVVAPLAAQNFSMDARRIAMGGVGDKKNNAADFAGDARKYKSIVVPIGLFQILRNLKIFNPNDSEFDPIRAMQNLASPLHYTAGRNQGTAGQELVKALVNAKLNRDLNTYRGFKPQSTLTSRGLIAPTMGHAFHGVYFGVGPYVAMGTTVNIDQKLINILASSTQTYSPNTNFLIKNSTEGQGAASITGGYRTRLKVPGQLSPASDRDGVYISGNYNYLYGIHYDTLDLDVRFDTDTQGLITLAPTTTPIVINRTSAQKGHGYAIDLGTDVVVGSWEARFSANGIGNRIDWEDLRATKTTLTSLFSGGKFVETRLPSPAAKKQVTLPVQYVGGFAYTNDKWAASADLSHGLEKTEFHTGGEYRMRVLEFRGGVRRSHDIWHPTAGVGLNVTKGFGVDLAVFSSATNIEREKKASIALSLRVGGN